MTNIMNQEIYAVKSRTVGKCLKACTFREDAWYIPDIQRSFVWDARQTLLLIDSLFRGWPFGVLTIETACATDGGLIPPRSFIEENDLQKESFERTVFQRQEDGLPEKFSLVLDGQQRLQSLVLAFGSNRTKFVQDEEKWYWQLCGDRPRKAHGRDYEMVKAMLSLDVDCCFRAYQEAEGSVAEIQFAESGAVCYTFVDAKEQSYYQDNPYLPFPVLRLSNLHLRLSKLWGLFDRLSDNESANEGCFDIDRYINIEDEWRNWNLDLNWIQDVHHKEFVQKLIVYLYERVYKQEVSYIELKRPDSVEHEVFQKKVVEIFTRLNKAGTQLEVGEVTAAWLKNAWKGRRSLDQVVYEFGRFFSDRALETPDFIRFISTLWTIEDVESIDRKVIQNKDLTNSVLLGKLANWFSVELKSIQSDIADVCDELARFRWMWNGIGARAFVLAVVLAYKRRIRLNRPGGNEQEKAEYDRKIGMLNIVRFLANSQWSSYWSVETIGTWAERWAKAISSNDVYKFKDEFVSLQKRLAQRAKVVFGEVRAGRGTVRRYYLYLQVWHRLNRERSNLWGVHMSHGVLDVDHCYAFARWESLLGKQAGQMTGDERSEIDPVVNSLGNCMLLERPKNIAKGKKTMLSFFKEISESERRALLLTTNMIAGDDQALTLQDLKEEIEQRNERMRQEIADFIDGKVECC